MRACDREMETCECCVAFTHFFFLLLLLHSCVLWILVPADETLDPFNPMSPVRIMVVRMKNETGKSILLNFQIRDWIQHPRKALSFSPQEAGIGEFY
jgi:hypothetical protein